MLPKRVALIGGGILCLALPIATAHALAFVPYGSSGYRYAVVTGDLPAGVELPGFDDSGFATGIAPFSNGSSHGIYTGATYWPADTKLVARLRFNVPSSWLGSGITLRFGIDNDATIFLNGQQIASVVSDGATYDQFTVPLFSNMLQAGENLLVALAVDRGGSTAFDLSLSADVPAAVVPYGASGYRYAITAGSFPVGVELPGFDDTGFAVGGAPFSSGGFGIYSPATYWPPDTKLVARLHFDVLGIPSRVGLRFGIDNDVTIFLNGQQVASVAYHSARYDDFFILVPDGILQPGENLLVALAVDRGGSTAFDVSLCADASGPTPATQETWGQIKSRYRPGARTTPQDK